MCTFIKGLTMSRVLVDQMALEWVELCSHDFTIAISGWGCALVEMVDYILSYNYILASWQFAYSWNILLKGYNDFSVIFPLAHPSPPHLLPVYCPQFWVRRCHWEGQLDQTASSPKPRTAPSQTSSLYMFSKFVGQLGFMPACRCPKMSFSKVT